MAVSASRSANAPAGGAQVGYALMTIAVLLMVAGLAAAYGVDALVRQHRAGPQLGDHDAVAVRTMGDRDLTIPLTWFRYEEQAVAGFATQVDLELQLPLGIDGALEIIEVSLVPRSRARPSSSLLDSVYLHQFTAEVAEGPPGLVGKPLSDADGFAGETVWYDALSADPFVAKCAPPVNEGARTECLRTVVLPSGIGAIYAFDADVLMNWRRFDDEMALWLGQIGAL